MGNEDGFLLGLHGFTTLLTKERACHTALGNASGIGPDLLPMGQPQDVLDDVNEMLINNLYDAPVLANRSMMRYGRFSVLGHPVSSVFSRSNMTHVRWFWGPL